MQTKSSFSQPSSNGHGDGAIGIRHARAHHRDCADRSNDLEVEFHRPCISVDGGLVSERPAPRGVPSIPVGCSQLKPDRLVPSQFEPKV